MDLEVEIHQIDLLIGAFFSAFDNRDGRTPSVQEVTRLMVQGAVIAKRTGDSFEITGPIPFAEPRVALLTDGRLVNFHEWETESSTEVQGRMAVRRSRYAKEGTWGGAPSSGGGSKVFQLINVQGHWRILSLAWEDDPD